MVRRTQPPPSKPDPRATAIWVPIDSVKPDPHNARERTPRNLDVIRKSLDRFGQRKPIVVDADGFVIAGNGTHQAATELGWSEIWASFTTLRGADAKAYAIADNRAGDLSQFDELELTAAVCELPADLLDVIGFDAAEISDLLPLPEEVDEGGSTKRTNSMGKPAAGVIMLRLMVAMQSVALIERAILATGITNREHAIKEVASGYLELKGQIE